MVSDPSIVTGLVIVTIVLGLMMSIKPGISPIYAAVGFLGVYALQILIGIITNDLEGEALCILGAIWLMAYNGCTAGCIWKNPDTNPAITPTGG